MSAERKPVRLLRAKLSAFMQLRAWIMAAGLFVTGWCLGGLLGERAPSDGLVMIVAVIGGFEFALYVNDAWRRGKRHG